MTDLDPALDGGIPAPERPGDAPPPAAGGLTERLVARLLPYPRPRLLLILWAGGMLGTYIFSIPLALFDPDYYSVLVPELPDDMSLPVAFFVLVLAAPVLETMVFQWGLLMLTRRITQSFAGSNSWLPALLASAMLHASIGFFDGDTVWLGLLVVLQTLPLTLALSLLAVVEREREGGRPVMAVILLNALTKLYVFVQIALYQIPA